MHEEYDMNVYERYDAHVDMLANILVTQEVSQVLGHLYYQEGCGKP